MTRPERRSHIQRRQSQGGPAALNVAASPVADKPVKQRRRRWPLALFLLLCLVGSAVISYAVFVNVGENVPPELAGLWQVTDGPLQGATLEFRRDGTVVATKMEHGTKSTTTSSAKIDGKKIYLTSKDDVSGKDDTVVQTIVRLNAEELIIRDMDKHIYRMKRVGG
jgi:uncharacterized protein (TIGR03066 family)